jgi:hypothetical protein
LNAAYRLAKALAKVLKATVRHDPRRGARSGGRRRPVAVACVLRGTLRSDVADEVAGVVAPHVVDEGFQLAGAHGTNRVFLAARPVGPQEFFQERVDRFGIAVRHLVLSVTGNRIPPAGSHAAARRRA